MTTPVLETWPFLSKLVDYTLMFVFGTAVASYAFMRRVKKDAREDKVADAGAEAEISVLEQLRNQLNYERDHSAELGKTIDRLADERNEAVQMAGKLEGEVTALTQQVEHLSEQVSELQRENEELRLLAQDSNENVKALKLTIEQLLKTLGVRPCVTLPECPKKDWKP